MRGGRVAIASASAALLGLVFAGGALACSCAPASPAQSLAAADAAIVGRLLSVQPHGAARAEYRYRVLRVFRGAGEIEPGAAVSVISPRGSAGCALPTRLERRYGLFLLGDGAGRWASGLCGVVSPRRLSQAARRSGEGARAASLSLTSCAG